MCRVALVLCGGFGTRFRAVSHSPKILAPYGSGRFIDWLIEYLLAQKFEQIFLSVHYKESEIKKYVSDKKYFHKINFISEEIPLGTGGATLNALERLDLNQLYVFNGDTFWSEPIPLEIFEENNVDIRVACKMMSINDRYGDIKLEGNKPVVRRGTSSVPIRNSMVFTGIAKVNRSVLGVKLAPPFSFEELLQAEHISLSISTYFGNMIDYGTPEAYQQMQGT